MNQFVILNNTGIEATGNSKSEVWQNFRNHPHRQSWFRGLREEDVVKKAKELGYDCYPATAELVEQVRVKGGYWGYGSLPDSTLCTFEEAHQVLYKFATLEDAKKDFARRYELSGRDSDRT
jgi:hypothetical protein